MQKTCLPDGDMSIPSTNRGSVEVQLLASASLKVSCINHINA